MAWHPNFDNDENGSIEREERMDREIRAENRREAVMRFLAAGGIFPVLILLALLAKAFT